MGNLLIPRIDHVFDSLGEEIYFRTFDLASSFFENAIHLDTASLSLFCTSPGLYDWLRMPQGAAAAALRCFQRLVQRVTDSLEDLIMS